jgi:SepF-like predicted cell division protein (DUF552 family)
MAGILERLRTDKGVDIEDYLDTLGVEEDDLLEEHANMWVRPYVLEEVVDVEKINDELKKGNMVLLNIEPLYKKNMIKLRQVVSELRGTTNELNGDIARLSEHRILITPSGVKIAKK